MAPTGDPPHALELVRTKIDAFLERFFARERVDIEAEHAAFLPLLEEVVRMALSGGKRLRPAFCFWGYHAAGGTDDDAILQVGAALELFHTFALIHDDVMDRGEARRGEPTIHVRMAKGRADQGGPDAEQFGTSAAILAGDFASVLADHLFLRAGFPPDRILAAFRRYNHMRIAVAIGQFLDIAGAGREVAEEDARRISLMKSGSYTVQGPLAVGAILGEGSGEVLDSLERYGTPLGEAFQIRDDLHGALTGSLDLAQAKPTVVLAEARRRAGAEGRDFIDDHTGRGTLSAGDRARLLEILNESGAVEHAGGLVQELVDHAISQLDSAILGEDPASALRELAESVRIPPG